MTKTEIKKLIQYELKAPRDFIERLRASGFIDNLQSVADDKAAYADIMKFVRQEWAYYCKTFELNPEDDNTSFKP